MHVAALDGIRGAAILLVFVYHAVLFGHVRPLTGSDRLLSSIAEAGWVGVDLFFVLSGFLITGILYDSKGQPGYFRNFYARRVLRIFPLYYAVLILIVIVMPVFGATEYLAPLIQDQVWYWTYLANIAFALHGWQSVSEVNHFWSLAIEEQFYLFWPLVVFALDRRRLMYVCSGMIVGSLIVRITLHAMGHHLAASLLTVARMDGLALGALIALAGREAGGWRRLTRRLQVGAVGSAALLALLFVVRAGLRHYDPLVSTYGLTLFAILFGGILAAALTAPPESILTRLFTHRFLRLLGRYSYALYVFHLPIIFVLGRKLDVGFVPAALGSSLIRQLVFTTVAGVVSLAAAMLSWHFYESQFLKLKAFFPRRSQSD